MPIELHQRAADELDAAWQHYHQVAPELADAMVRETWRMLRLAADNPAMGLPGRVPATREINLSAFPYLIAYRVIDDRLRVLAVFHTRRQPPDDWG